MKEEVLFNEKYGYHMYMIVEGVEA